MTMENKQQLNEQELTQVAGSGVTVKKNKKMAKEGKGDNSIDISGNNNKVITIGGNSTGDISF